MLQNLQWLRPCCIGTQIVQSVLFQVRQQVVIDRTANSATFDLPKHGWGDVVSGFKATQSQRLLFQVIERPSARG